MTQTSLTAVTELSAKDEVLSVSGLHVYGANPPVLANAARDTGSYLSTAESAACPSNTVYSVVSYPALGVAYHPSIGLIASDDATAETPQWYDLDGNAI